MLLCLHKSYQSGFRDIVGSRLWVFHQSRADDAPASLGRIGNTQLREEL